MFLRYAFYFRKLSLYSDTKVPGQRANVSYVYELIFLLHTSRSTECSLHLGYLPSIDDTHYKEDESDPIFTLYTKDLFARYNCVITRMDDTGETRVAICGGDKQYQTMKGFLQQIYRLVYYNRLVQARAVQSWRSFQATVWYFSKYLHIRQFHRPMSSDASLLQMFQKLLSMIQHMRKMLALSVGIPGTLNTP